MTTRATDSLRRGRFGLRMLLFRNPNPGWANRLFISDPASITVKRLFLILMGPGMLLVTGCGEYWSPSKRDVTGPYSPIASADEATRVAIRHLEERVKQDPQDFIAFNKLAGYYLQQLRETGNLIYLDLARKAAEGSLAAVSEEYNTGGLGALAQVELASHGFVAARDHALRLRELDPGRAFSHQILGDALLELGDYEEATKAYGRMEQISGLSISTETRMARLAWLRGDLESSKRHFNIAVKLALETSPVPRETVAWCQWQLGELAFSGGDYETAEAHYRDSLATFPNYFHALASLGRVRAAREDRAEAIALYERVVRLLPDPTYVAALGDLYHLAGREKEAAAQYALVGQIALLHQAGGALYDRQLAIFYADRDINAEAAYASALREYETRRDVYGADALAWSALKAGRIDEARTAIREAMRLGTPDARIFYHAGMIARAGGDTASARDHLKRALALNPQFDPMQAMIARRTIEELAAE